jgi:hypothetical protein
VVPVMMMQSAPATRRDDLGEALLARTLMNTMEP